ncbi:MAG TPA: DUF4347 domain-containing protein [Polyangiales bacterium]|nr:DUF4347 domain-containing protein [Polyangiales bacterium]
MATVWAHVAGTGKWTSQPSTGWSHTIEIKGLADLASSLGKASLGGRVTQLGIVAHGDAPGQVVLERKLTPSSIDTFDTAWTRLGGYLSSDGMLAFYSCIAGRGPEGTALLTAISTKLRGRTIVGFELYGLIGSTGMPNAPGAIVATDSSSAEQAIDRKVQYGRLTPWCPFAKRARNGEIVHYPILEQADRPNKRCANPACPGHKEPGHFCQGW